MLAGCIAVDEVSTTSAASLAHADARLRAGARASGTHKQGGALASRSFSGMVVVLRCGLLQLPPPERCGAPLTRIPPNALGPEVSNQHL